jgi:hypothetical protein
MPIYLKRIFTRRRLLRPRRASGCLGTSRGSSRGSSSTTSTMSRVPARRAARHAAHRQLRLRRTSGCLCTSRGSSRHSSSTTPPRASSPSTIWPTLRIWVPRHVVRLVLWLIVDYFASRKLVRRTSGGLGSSRDSSRGSSSPTSPTPCVRVPWHVARLVTRLVVDYFTYTARPGASARRAARHAARCRLLHLRRASGCLDTSRGSSCGSSSTTSPRAGSYATRLGGSARHTARRAPRH